MLAIKNMVLEMENAFIWFTYRLNKVKERISKYEDKSLEIYPNWITKIKTCGEKNKTQSIQELWGNLK